MFESRQIFDVHFGLERREGVLRQPVLTDAIGFKLAIELIFESDQLLPFGAFIAEEG
jgi:hypothetical protein